MKLSDRINSLSIDDFEKPFVRALNDEIHYLLAEPKCIQPPFYLHDFNAVSWFAGNTQWGMQKSKHTGLYVAWVGDHVDQCHVSAGYTPAMALIITLLRNLNH